MDKNRDEKSITTSSNVRKHKSTLQNRCTVGAWMLILNTSAKHCLVASVVRYSVWRFFFLSGRLCIVSVDSVPPSVGVFDKASKTNLTFEGWALSAGCGALHVSARPIQSFARSRSKAKTETIEEPPPRLPGANRLHCNDRQIRGHWKTSAALFVGISLQSFLLLPFNTTL